MTATQLSLFSATEKACSKCGQVKSLADFHPRKDSHQSHRSQCKPCQHETNRSTRDMAKRRECERLRRAENPERFKETQTRYRERHREALRRRRAERYRASPKAHRAAVLKYQRAHPEYRREYMARWRAENADRLREYQKRHYAQRRDYYAEKGRQWRAQNRDRARAINVRHSWRKRGAPGDYSRDQLAARWAYYGGCCWMCGGVANTTDHVIPLSRGGSNWPANLRPACRPCNSGKKDRDWRAYREPTQGALPVNGHP